MKNWIKVGINFGFRELGKVGVKATRTVAGKAAVDAGENIISESIVEGVSVLGSKLAERLFQDLMKDKKKN